MSFIHPIVSSEKESKLKLAFEKLADTKVDLNGYDGSLFEVACEIFTSETFVAGIADTILDGGRIALSHKVVAESPLILDRTFWVRKDGETFDLKQDVVLLDL